MAVPNKRGSLFLASLALAFCAIAVPARADEIRLKGGRKLYGVIVAYEDNMFKVKTEFGYELIEKDKIESIIPSTPAGKSEPASALKKDAPQHPASQRPIRSHRLSRRSQRLQKHRPQQRTPVKRL